MTEDRGIRQVRPGVLECSLCKAAWAESRGGELHEPACPNFPGSLPIGVEGPARPAWLGLQSWAGFTKQEIVVVGETAKRYRITTASKKPVRLAGRLRYLQPGEVALVPKTAVTWRPE